MRITKKRLFLVAIFILFLCFSIFAGVYLSNNSFPDLMMKLQFVLKAKSEDAPLVEESAPTGIRAMRTADSFPKMQPAATGDVAAVGRYLGQSIAITFFSHSGFPDPVHCPEATSEYLSNTGMEPRFSDLNARPAYIVCTYFFVYAPESNNPKIETYNAAASLLFHTNEIPPVKQACPRDIFKNIPEDYQCQILISDNRLMTSNLIYSGKDINENGQSLPPHYFVGESAHMTIEEKHNFTTNAPRNCKYASIDKPVEGCDSWAVSPAMSFIVGDAISISKAVKFKKHFWSKPIEYHCSGLTNVDPSWLSSANIYVDCCPGKYWNPDKKDPYSSEESGLIKTSTTNRFPCSEQNTKQESIPVFIIFFSNPEFPDDLECPKSKSKSLINGNQYPTFIDPNTKPPYMVCDYLFTFMQKNSTDPQLEKYLALAKLLFGTDTIPATSQACPTNIFEKIPPNFQCQLIVANNKLITSNYIYSGDSFDANQERAPGNYFIGQTATLTINGNESVSTKVPSRCKYQSVNKPEIGCDFWATTQVMPFEISKMVSVVKRVQIKKHWWSKPIDFHCTGSTMVQASWRESPNVYIDCCPVRKWNPDEPPQYSLTTSRYEVDGLIMWSLTNRFPCTEH